MCRDKGALTALSSLHRLEVDVMNAIFVREAEEAAARRAEEDRQRKDLPKLIAEMDRILTDLPESIRVQIIGKWLH